MVDIKQEKLERFVRESAWEYENVEEHLRQTVPEAAQGAASALILDGMGIPKQGPVDHISTSPASREELASALSMRA